MSHADEVRKLSAVFLESFYIIDIIRYTTTVGALVPDDSQRKTAVTEIVANLARHATEFEFGRVFSSQSKPAPELTEHIKAVRGNRLFF